MVDVKTDVGIGQATEAPKPRTLAERIFWKEARNPDRMDTMKLLFRGGKLSPKYGDWNNALNHSLVVGASAGVVGEAMGLPTKDANQLTDHAYLHDWDKRLGKRKGDFSPEELQRADELKSKAMIDEEFLRITDPEGAQMIARGEASFLQKVLMYLDDVASGDVLVTPRVRMEETKARQPDLDEAFWANQIRVDEEIQREIVEKMKSNGIEIADASDLPAWINTQLENKYA